MTSGSGLFVEVDRNIEQSLTFLTVDGDTSTEGSTSPDLILSSEVPTLNVNAPAFTAAVSTMTPVIITKNVDIGNERWKPNATITEENVNNISIAELPQPFIGTDGLYYWPTEVVNNYAQPVVVETVQNGGNVVNGHDGQLYPQQLTGPELANHAIQNDAVPKDIPPEELKRLIQLQFEYYFSRENLANDSYLVSQMDGDQYVSISTVAKFNQVRKLTSNMDLIVEALQESPYVQLDETNLKVRANMKRCIVILREIPESTPVEEVKALFIHPDCPKWVSFEFAHNDSWYVTFDCEEDAKKAYKYLREEVKNFHGRPLMARIKAKTLLSRTVYLPKSAPSTNMTVTTPTESTAQFTPTPQPITTFTVPPNAVFHQPQTFPFYATAAPVNGNPLLPGTWLAPRQFISPEVRPKNNYNKHNGHMSNRVSGQRPFYGSKPRHQFRGGYNKVPMYDRNGIIDNDDRQTNSQFRRGNVNAINFRKDDPRFVRNSNPPKKDYRGNLEESPRFQRLRERRTKDEPSKSPDTESDDISSTSELTLDLALENFPALPSPNSPNENSKSASSLKELATHALQIAQDKTSSDETSPTSHSDMSETSTDEQMSTSSITTDALLMTVSTSSAVSVAASTNAPKISYAQMAQKPNKTSHAKDVFENDKDLPELSTGEATKKNNSKNDSKNSGSGTPRSQRRSSKGSPRAQRGKTNQDNKTNSKPDKNIDNNSSNDTAVVTTSSVTVKETYASKFGKNTATKSAPTTQRSNGQKSQVSNANRSSQKINTTNLPPPRPLMSQIIKPPEGKLNEIANQEQNLLSGENGKSSEDVLVVTDAKDVSTESNKENVTN